MIQRISPDPQKAKALRELAKITLQRLETTDQEKYPANTLTDYYDSIHKLMEAITLERGVKCKGDGAHQELIDYLAKEKVFDEKTRVFLQELRDYRNRITYEGLSIQPIYIRQRKKIFLEIIQRLQQ